MFRKKNKILKNDESIEGPDESIEGPEKSIAVSYTHLTLPTKA